MDVRTHAEIDPELSGTPIEVGDGFARVELATTERMAADERGLVHGGFIFSLADHAAMLAVNHPNVVLGRAESRFLRPVTVGERVVAVARLAAEEGNRRRVDVEVESAEGVSVFAGEFVCYTPERHVPDRAARAD